MNPLISANSSLFLPLNQLLPHCNRLSSTLVNDSIPERDRISQEQTLWNEVKKVRALKDSSVFSYLIGYYHTLLFQITRTSRRDDLFQYHVLIRLGDLNRYMERIDVAEYYYCNARNLFPFYGHAYNQLGLLTKPINCYKCCYYYARAAKSSERPLTSVAASNLRIAVAKYNCEFLNQILDGKVGEEGKDPAELPKKAFDWFYAMVIAIYSDNIRPISKLFLNYLDENFSIQRSTELLENVRRTTIYCDQDSYMLLATLDILLDWLRLSSTGKDQCSNLLQELRKVRSCIQSAIVSLRSNSISDLSVGSDTDTINSTSLTSSTLKDITCTSDPSIREDTRKPLAFPHDQILLGFSPLDKLHNGLEFGFDSKCSASNLGSEKESNNERFLESNQIFMLLMRLRTKMDVFGPLLKRRTRNIALESILSHMI